MMKELIKAIRSAANMNQEQFANALGTTTLSINRWENGKTLPNRMAQTQLYNFCQENSISVYQTILDKIKAESVSINLEDGRALLYHGSKSGIVGDIAPKSREMCDFGKGFYMGTDPGQPLTLICDFENPSFISFPLIHALLIVLRFKRILIGLCSLPSTVAEWIRSRTRIFITNTAILMREKTS